MSLGDFTIIVDNNYVGYERSDIYTIYHWVDGSMKFICSKSSYQLAEDFIKAYIREGKLNNIL